MAFGLPWTPGDNVVGIARDFPSNRVVWEALDGLGVEFRAVDINLATDPEIALIAACDRRTRVLAVSWVHYVTGLRLDLERLGSHCRGRGILFCIDAIQGLGALRLDVQACGADFVAADGHKWLLGPEGVALFYVSPGAARPGILLLGPDVPLRWSGIVSFRPLYASAEDWVNHLGKQGICCAARSGAVRLSPHFYNDVKEMEVALHL